MLNHKGISTIGDERWFVTFARNVTELDLGWNRIRSWEVIATLFSSLPSLKRLNLGHNPIEPAIGTSRLPKLERLSTLVLNGVNLPLPSLYTLLEATPALTELHLSENNFQVCLAMPAISY